jgi:Zn-dependent protease with chaperone function
VDFFTRQAETRRASRALVGIFLLAFIICALATTAVTAIALRLYTENNTLFLGTETWTEWLAAHLLLVGGIAAGTLGVMGFASLYRSATLSGGGGQVARMLGATQVTGDGTDPLQRRLRNVVEEMALASGVPVPEVYVLEHETGINAFAAGTTTANAAIAVTRGALERLTRAELQGVIGHEFSHILNGDMRLNQQLIGLSFGILVLALAGRWLLRSARYTRRGRNSGGVAAALTLGAALLLIGWIGVFLSRLIKAGVSRQREALADASAVQFTREPQGLAGALKKIAAHTSRFSSVDSEEVSHMLFERGARSFSGWFATHPPIVERIKALEPGFDPRNLPTAAPPIPPPAGAEERVSTAVAGLAPLTGAAPLERAGTIDAPEVGGALRAALPDELQHAARSRDGSLLLIAALALSDDERTRERQVALLESQLGRARAAHCARLHRDLSSTPRHLRLPLVELAAPALKQRPPEQVSYLFDLLRRMAELDVAPRLFDFVLLHVLASYFRGQWSTALAIPSRMAPESLSKRRAVRILLANVAAFGSSNAAEVNAAYAAGLAELGARAGSSEPAVRRDLGALGAALQSLAATKPNDKLRILNAVHAAIRADRKIEIDEYELFRAIAATLDCPLPPRPAI